MPALFDRIVEPNHGSGGHSIAAEIRSVQTELNRLLNTRTYTKGMYPAAKRTVLTYGLHEIVSYGENGGGKLPETIAAVKRAIECYEPRLFGVLVNASYVNGSPLNLSLEIAGRLKSCGEYVQFKVPITLPGTSM